MRMGPIVGHPAGEFLIASTILPDGREACLIPLSYGRARITVGPAGVWWLDDGW